MKRSEINALIRRAREVFLRQCWHLPPFADFTPEIWAGLGPEYSEIRECMLGWDITDFGSGDFYKVGLLLFTLRNGNVKGGRRGDGPADYAEKLMLVQENQVTPLHFHERKSEDIIVRGGGNLMVRLQGSLPDGGLSDAPFSVKVDGRYVELMPGALIRIQPGSSITMHPRLYHSFWGDDGAGEVVVGEVSLTNDDETDNRFFEPRGRFPEIDEDEPAEALLVSDYITKA